MSIYFPDGKGGKKLVGTDSGGGASYAEATTVASGLMSASDKAKLDGINPSQLVTKSDLETITPDLPTASETVKGGVKINANGSHGLIMDGDTLRIPFFDRHRITLPGANLFLNGDPSIFFGEPGNIYLSGQPNDGEAGTIYLYGNGSGTGGRIYLNGGGINANNGNGNAGIIKMNGGTNGALHTGGKGGTIQLNGGENADGGEIDLIGGSNGKGGIIDMSGSTGGTIKGNIYFAGTPTFLNGANGLDIATVSGATIPTATTSQSGLMSASDKSKLNGIASNAQVNVIETVKVSGTALAVSGKAVNIDLSGKVDTVSGKGLSTNDYTNADKAKLTNLASITTAGENITINNGTISAEITDFSNKTIDMGYATVNASLAEINIGMANLSGFAPTIRANGGLIALTNRANLDFSYSAAITGDPIFTGTPTFNNGFNGTVSSATVYIATTAYDSIMNNFATVSGS